MRHSFSLYLSAHPKFFPHPWLIFRKDSKLQNTFQRHVNAFSKYREFPTVQSGKPQPPPPPVYPALNLGQERSALRGYGSPKNTAGQAVVVARLGPLLHGLPFSIPSLQTRIPGGPWSLEAAFGVWLCGAATCSPGKMTAQPSETPVSQGAKGLNINCSTKGHFFWAARPCPVRNAEGSQGCKCTGAVPRRPRAPALCKIPSGFYFAEATALFCVTREHLGKQLSAYK